MLSRTADNLYWLARYVERAEYLARILEATQRLTAMPLEYIGETNEWESAVATAGCAGAFNSWWFVIALPIAMLAVTKLAIEPEEAYLERKFGAAYVAYKTSVRRWI